MISIAQKETSVFTLKADFLALTVLKINKYNLKEITTQLEETFQKAPQYFNYAPLIIDITDITDKSTLDLEKLCNLLRSKKLLPIGIRGLPSSEQTKVSNYGLALLNNNNTKPVENKTTSNPVSSTHVTSTNTKIINKPIRAGTKIYAQGGDLIILTSVNAGAECIADGNIHVYGPLRGRALAGASGNTQARIFCQTLEAELVSIAGHYLVNEQLKVPKSKTTLLQIYLDKKEKIKIENV